MARIETEYLEQLINLASLTFEEDLVILNYDSDGFLISATYDGMSDEVTELDAYVSDIGLTLTLPQEDLIGLHLENSYRNKTILDAEMHVEFLEDLNYEQHRDNLNDL
tara:strand:- start:1382 stop:1705 length:324 start_codon:yes stop_codon:yes gene_type:complete